MDTEIKINESEIEQVLQQIKGAAEALESSIPTNMDGNNLELVVKLTEINQGIEDLLENYKTLVLQNNELTFKSVQQMLETDQQISTSIHLK